MVLFTTLKYAKYAAYCAVACIAWRMVDRACARCCEKGDDWNIEEECGRGELAAGYLRKKGKGADVWSKRYIVLAKGKLIYYMDQMRDKQNGEIVIAGASATASSTRADEDKKFYFEITHPECGTREFYAKSDMRRRQWINKINALSADLSSMSHWGTLKKKGGLISEVWQSRWCCSNSETLDYYDEATSSKSKGSIDIRAAIMKPSAHEQQPYCIEIEQRAPSKGRFGQNKSGKVYYFAAESEAQRDLWLQMLRAGASRFDESTLGPDGEEVMNPIASGEGEVVGGEGGGLEGQEWRLSGMLDSSGSGGGGGSKSRGPARGMESHLDKKSKNMLSLAKWQRRYFKLDKERQALLYYKERDSKGSGGGGGGDGGGTPGSVELTPPSKAVTPKSSAFAKLAALEGEGDGGGVGGDNAPGCNGSGVEASTPGGNDSRNSSGNVPGWAATDDPIPVGKDLKEKEKGAILITSIRGSNITRKDNNSFSFEVKSGRVYHLRASNAEERDTWVEVMEEWMEFYQD